ncbi:NAD-dependent epimerase/dehydratase family protein [Streptosporangium sp. NPDC000396]|uniref:NAD-dependent epimerase/dehydratase family protein n=1 Tax=Streptosporangium sp. NPDC000396 TaxID=3366185 RepID=UPI0036A68D62
MSFHVVLGAGATGTATARLLADSGERVRQITRRGTGVEHPLVELVAADATDAARLTELVEGASTLINCAAPPYDRWPEEFPPLAAALLTAAGRTGAGYVMLGNHYGYGAVDGPLTEDLPMAPTAVKGQVRAKMWTDALTSGVRVTEVRASDFVGAGGESLFNLTVTPALLSGEPARYPGDLDAPHSWSFVGDVARALVAVSRDERAWGRAWHVPSAATISPRELAVRLAEATGAPEPVLEPLSAGELAAVGESVPVMAEVIEMLYLFDRPFVVDSSLTEQTFDLKPTLLDDVLAGHLQ